MPQAKAKGTVKASTGRARAAAGRQMTTEEASERFLEVVWAQVQFWKRQLGPADAETMAALEGVAFSILVLLDGYIGMNPAFRVTPLVDRDWATDAEKHGLPCWPISPDHDDQVDIAGSLHDRFNAVGHRLGFLAYPSSVRDG
jgi:hypothetical protein